MTIKDIQLNDNDKVCKLIEDQEFGFKNMYNLLKQNPGMVKMTMFDQLWQSYGTNSPTRKQILNNAFKLIVKYLLPDDCRISFAIADNIDLKKLDVIKKMSYMPKYK